MKKLDNDGLKLCIYQAQIFEASPIKFQGSSKIFLRRFYKSQFATILDEGYISKLSLSIEEAFESIERQFGKTSYGQIKYDKDELYWIGYITRYISYTRQVSSIFVYKTFPIPLLLDSYKGYHSQGEEWVISHLLEALGLDESYFDVNVRLKNLLRKEQSKEKSI